MFCKSLYVHLSFFFWPLFCHSFFDLRILITLCYLQALRPWPYYLFKFYFIASSFGWNVCVPCPRQKQWSQNHDDDWGHASRLDILPVYMITLSRRNSDKVTYNFWLRTCQLQFDVCWKLCMRAYNDQIMINVMTCI